MRNHIEIHFDGGCRPTNPGNKYGSFEVLLNGFQVFKASRLEFGYGTNNEAEFDSLMKAIHWTIEELNRGGFPAKLYTVSLFTDSTIVSGRIAKRNFGGKSEPARRMAALARQCVTLLDQFSSWTIKWNGRNANVQRFGH